MAHKNVRKEVEKSHGSCNMIKIKKATLKVLSAHKSHGYSLQGVAIFARVMKVTSVKLFCCIPSLLFAECVVTELWIIVIKEEKK